MALADVTEPTEPGIEQGIRKQFREAPFVWQGWRTALSALGEYLLCTRISMEWIDLCDGFSRTVSAVLDPAEDTRGAAHPLHSCEPPAHSQAHRSGHCMEADPVYRIGLNAFKQSRQAAALPGQNGFAASKFGMRTIDVTVDLSAMVHTRLRIEIPAVPGHLTPEQTALIEACLPVIRRAAEQTSYFAELRALNQWTLSLAGEIGLAVFLCTPDGQIRYANALAEDLIGRELGLTERARRLRALDPDADQALRQALKKADDGPTARVVSLPQNDVTDPLFARVLRLPITLRKGAPEDGPLNAVLVMDPHARAKRMESRLVSEFSFSPRQAQVACLLMEGLTLSDIAERLGISRETAKTHLKRAFELTETCRQSQLVKFLTSISALPAVNPSDMEAVPERTPRARRSPDDRAPRQMPVY